MPQLLPFITSRGAMLSIVRARATQGWTAASSKSRPIDPDESIYAVLTTCQIGQIMKRKTIWLQRQVGVRSFAPYPDVKKLLIHTDMQPQSFAHDFYDSFPYPHIPPLTADAHDKPSLIFVGASNFETGHRLALSVAVSGRKNL
jgi:hypothetical protein